MRTQGSGEPVKNPKQEYTVKGYPGNRNIEVFNICGGKYRLVVRRSLNWKTLFVVAVMSHSDYDRNLWKKFCKCR